MDLITTMEIVSINYINQSTNSNQIGLPTFSTRTNWINKYYINIFYRSSTYVQLCTVSKAARLFRKKIH